MNTLQDRVIAASDGKIDGVSYDQWFHSNVAKSLEAANDPKTPRYRSDEVLRRIFLQTLNAN